MSVGLKLKTLKIHFETTCIICICKNAEISNTKKTGGICLFITKRHKTSKSDIFPHTSIFPIVFIQFQQDRTQTKAEKMQFGFIQII